MLKARKSSQLKRDPHKDKKLYETKKLKKVGQGTPLVSKAEKEKTIFRKAKLDKDLKLPQIKKLYSQLKAKQKDKILPPLVKHSVVKEALAVIKPNLKKLEFKRLGSRILTACLKYGDAAARKELLNLLEPDFLSLCFGKYSYVLAKQIAKTNNIQLKNKLVSIVKQNILKMLRSPESAEVAEIIFESSNGAAQTSIIDSFYGSEYAGVVATKHLSLKEYLKGNEDTIRDNLEPRISKLIDKALITLSLVQHILLSFIQATQVDLHIRFMNESNLQVSFAGLLSSRIGVKVACYFYTISDAKQRKHLVKELKEDVKDYAKNKVTFLMILKILKETDDTVLTKRLLLAKLIGGVNDLVLDLYFQKLIGSLISADQKRLLTEDQVETLKLGQQHSTSKKESEKRRAQLIDQENLNQLVNGLILHMDSLISDGRYKFIAVVANFALESSQEQSDEIAKKLMIQIKSGVEESKTDLLMDPAGHRFLKEIIKLENQGQNQPLVSIYCWARIKEDFLKYIKEKSVFVIVALIEHCSSLKKKVRQLQEQILQAAKKQLKTIEKEVSQLEKKGKLQSGAKLLFDLVK